jgi:hypothetical protein
MDKNLRDYVKVYSNYIDKDVCEKTIRELKFANWQQHYFDGSENDKTTLSGNDELSISWGTLTTSKILMKSIWNGLEQYVLNDCKFSWHQGWQGYTDIRFNRYSANKKMAEHCDHIVINDGTRKGIPVLSFVGVLNDDYEGGEFIMFQDEVIELKQGDLMVFPSVFLFPHRVEPVTKGTRHTFVSWSW